MAIPTASRIKDTAHQKPLPPVNSVPRAPTPWTSIRRHAHEQSRLDRLDAATGVFFTVARAAPGHDHWRHAKSRSAFAPHEGADRRTARARASCSQHMIAFGDEGGSATAPGSVRLAPDWA